MITGKENYYANNPDDTTNTLVDAFCDETGNQHAKATVIKNYDIFVIYIRNIFFPEQFLNSFFIPTYLLW